MTKDNDTVQIDLPGAHGFGITTYDPESANPSWEFNWREGCGASWDAWVELARRILVEDARRKAAQ
ncbi:MAG: hypothetical protein AAF205_00200 [Pseudomonadota bacterium]